MYTDHENWRRIQEWLDVGHNLLENCKNNVQELVESNRNHLDFEDQYRYLQERIRSVLDQPLWWYSQEDQKVRQFWQELSPQSMEGKHQLHQDTAQWVQARNQLVPPQDNRALDYSWQLQEYQRRSEEWLDQGSNLIERHNELKQYCEPELQRREDPKSRYAILCIEIRKLRLVCDSERKRLEELVRPSGENPGNYIQESRQVKGTSTAPDPQKSAIQRHGQQEPPNGETRKRAPYKKRKTAESEAVDTSIKDQLVEAGTPFVEELENDFAYLDNNPLSLPIHENNESYYEDLKDYVQRIEKRVQRLQYYQEAFDQQFRIHRLRDAERARRDLAYKKRKIAEKKSGVKYFPIEDHPAHIQKLDQQLRESTESQSQAMNYAVGLLKAEERNRSEQSFHKAPYPEAAPEFARPSYQGTPSRIPADDIHRMPMPISDLQYPPSHAKESSKLPTPLAAPSGQHARDPIQLGSDFSISNKSSPTSRLIPAIEIPVKRKRGRPPGSTSYQRTSLSSMPPILPSPSRPHVQSCPDCNFAYSKLIPACPHHAPTAKIRLMLDNLKGIKDDSQQVAAANKLLKEALASKSAAQTSLRK
ncbi:hypothetical protein BCON_0116g00210 [Botryotinia convoluta]|uniref:Uncharacterized protein n=1 Tax=Botryotinia convoluta TaxID=54673 RepID=A0A4Z1IB40_9HELO|nr:hypothetical protein BCON_0116g00210 [Botryotinia convoluta]